MSANNDTEPMGLAPDRRASLRFGQRPRTACGTLDNLHTLPRSRTSRWSLNPMTFNNDVLDWRTFNRDQEQEDCAILSPSDPPTARMDEPRPATSLQSHSHQRRASTLSQSVKHGLSELKSLGRRMSLSLNLRGKSSRSNTDSVDLNRPSHLIHPQADRSATALEGAQSQTLRGRWHLRSPSTRRRPSLPLLDSMRLEPLSVPTSTMDQQIPRVRGQPVLSDLVYGGAGARASAAAQNERYQASRETPLPPYTPRKEDVLRDSESGIGIGLEEISRRPSASERPHPTTQDPAEVLAMELVEGIFSYLDLTSLLEASLVSRRWRQLSRSQAVWREVFVRDFGPKQPMPFWKGQVRHIPGMGKARSGQDYSQLYKVRTQIDKRWTEGKAAALYLNGHKDSVYCVQFDEEKIITGSRDHTIRVWDAHTYQCIRKLGPPNNHRERGRLDRGEIKPAGVKPFFQAEISSPDPDGPVLESWHQASVLCLQYDNEILVSGSSDFSCLVWDIKQNYKPKFRLIGHTAGVLDLCIDRRYIITCSKDTTIKMWDKNTGQLLKTLLGHRGPVNAVQVRGNLLASASGDGMAKLWRLEDGLCVKEFQSKDRGLACVEFSEDGRTIFAGGNDKVIYEYDTVTGQRLRELMGHDGLVRSLHLDSANSRIISGSYDQSIKVWDIKKGESVEDGGLKLDFRGWTSSWMLSAKSNYRKIVCTSQDGRVVIIDFGYGIEGVDMVEA